VGKEVRSRESGLSEGLETRLDMVPKRKRCEGLDLTLTRILQRKLTNQRLCHTSEQSVT